MISQEDNPPPIRRRKRKCVWWHQIDVSIPPGSPPGPVLGTGSPPPEYAELHTALNKGKTTGWIAYSPHLSVFMNRTLHDAITRGYIDTTTPHPLVSYFPFFPPTEDWWSPPPRFEPIPYGKTITDRIRAAGTTIVSYGYSSPSKFTGSIEDRNIQGHGSPSLKGFVGIGHIGKYWAYIVLQGLIPPQPSPVPKIKEVTLVCERIPGRLPPPKLVLPPSTTIAEVAIAPPCTQELVNIPASVGQQITFTELVDIRYSTPFLSFGFYNVYNVTGTVTLTHDWMMANHSPHYIAQLYIPNTWTWTFKCAQPPIIPATCSVNWTRVADDGRSVMFTERVDIRYKESYADAYYEVPNVTGLVTFDEKTISSYPGAVLTLDPTAEFTGWSPSSIKQGEYRCSAIAPPLVELDI